MDKTFFILKSCKRVCKHPKNIFIFIFISFSGLDMVMFLEKKLLKKVSNKMKCLPFLDDLDVSPIEKNLALLVAELIEVCKLAHLYFD